MFSFCNIFYLLTCRTRAHHVRPYHARLIQIFLFCEYKFTFKLVKGVKSHRTENESKYCRLSDFRIAKERMKVRICPVLYGKLIQEKILQREKDTTIPIYFQWTKKIFQ